MKNKRYIKGWLGGAAAGAAIALATVACGDDFSGGKCNENRTCAPTGGASSHGAEGGAAAGDATSPNAGADSGAVGVSGGQGGEGATTIGMTCTKDAECDDGDSCSGVETCVDGSCSAGKAVKCPAGLACSAAKNDACIFPSAAPWIVYTADADTKGVDEAYGVKVDLLGTMTPVKLSPELKAGLHVYGDNSQWAWSPDGSGVTFTTADKGPVNTESHLLRFGDGLPQPAVLLTKGMSASTFSNVAWSPSGNSLLVSRQDGLHVVDIAADGSVTQSKATPDGYDQVQGWIKNDNEVVYVARNAISTKLSVALAIRSGGAWTRKVLVDDLGTLLVALPSRDRSQLGYITSDAQALRTLSIVETLDGSKPTKIAAGLEVRLSASPDASHFVLATSDKTTAITTVFGGAAATLAAPPVLKLNLTIQPGTVLGASAEGAWAPDSSRAALFQHAAIGKQLVIYEPGAATEWLALPLTQALGDIAPLWSPDSKRLVLPTRASAASRVALSLVGFPGNETRELDSVPSAGIYDTGSFSAAGDFFVYAKGEGPGAVTNSYYIDLRQGAAAASEPIEIAGALAAREFASHGSDFIYVRDAKDCFYLDLSGESGTEPVRVDEAGTVTSCRFQKLP